MIASIHGEEDFWWHTKARINGSHRSPWESISKQWRLALHLPSPRLALVLEFLFWENLVLGENHMLRFSHLFRVSLKFFGFIIIISIVMVSVNILVILLFIVVLFSPI